MTTLPLGGGTEDAATTPRCTLSNDAAKAYAGTSIALPVTYGNTATTVDSPGTDPAGGLTITYLKYVSGGTQLVAALTGLP